MAKYWVKAWIEILNDSKMQTLPDRLWRRTMELFLAAGHYDQDGRLPNTSQLAWLFRMNTDELELDLQQIATTGIVQRTADGWLVTQFAKRQERVPGSDRTKQYRERQKQQQYYGDSNDVVTKRHIETEQIQNRTETDTEVTAPSVFFNPSKILCDASGLSTFPANQLQWIEVVHSLVEDYGVENATGAMKSACTRWAGTKNKYGKNYPKTNLAWIQWAQEELASSPPDYSDVDINTLTGDELMTELKRRVEAQK